MKKQVINKWSVLIVIGILFLLLCAGGCFFAYRMLWAPNFQVNKTVYIYIDEKKDFEDLIRQLTDSANNRNLDSFVWLANRMDYPEQMKTGRYAVVSGTTNLDLLKMLIRGNQTAVRFTFNNIRLTEELAERIDAQLMMNKDELLLLLTDSAFCDSLGFTTETVKSMFIPDTYEVYWNITPANFLKRMKKEYNAFWTPERLVKAEAISLTPIEVATLASIVEEETAARDEYPIVAGLYLNRLHRGIPLQADPTLKFAVGDFTLKRILDVHKEVDSPYNTYKYAGLPPGPLRVPSSRGLDAVLNYMRHDYIYMCAKEDFSGRHNFAITLSEHNRNANRYRAELNRRNIR